MFDINNADHRLALKNEVIKDPLDVGYQAVIDASTIEALGLLNNPDKNPHADEVSIPEIGFVSDAIGKIDPDEYDNLSSVHKTVIDNVITRVASGENAELGSVKGLFKAAFGESSITWNELNKEKKRHASRAEALFGVGTVITRQNWIESRES